MSDEPPTPPTSLSTEVANALNDPHRNTCGTLRATLRNWPNTKSAKIVLRKSRTKTSEGRPDELPDDVPSRATITIKEINDNRYYYWQWREGDKIRSQYKGPVDPDE